jgi:nucleoside-diphosphate-sugar epimerase
VTGCAGFVGSHLCDALLARGDEVVGIDSFTDYYPRETKERNLLAARDHAGFSLIEADLAVADLDSALPEADAVFHLAAQGGVRGSWGSAFARYASDNILATQRVFDVATRRGLRVVWASSSSVYGNAERYPTPEETRPRPISPYGVTKLTCEHLAAAYDDAHDLDSVALRYFTVYGPRQRPDMAFARIARALAEGGPFRLLGTGQQSRDVTYVADAVSATLLAMERGRRGHAYNVGGGSEGSLIEAIRLAERLSGLTLELQRSDPAAGDPRRTAADTSAARGDLGWSPRVGLEEGLAEHLRWAGALP